MFPTTAQSVVINYRMDALGKMLRADQTVIGEQASTLQDIPELANIPGEAMQAQSFKRFQGDLG